MPEFSTVSGDAPQARVHEDAVPQVPRLRPGSLAPAFRPGRCWSRCRPSWKRTTTASATLFESVVTSPQFRNQRCKDFTPSRCSSPNHQEANDDHPEPDLAPHCSSRAWAFTVALPWLESVPRLRPADRPACRRRRRSGSPACSSATASRRRTGGRRGRARRWSWGRAWTPLAPFKEKINVINGLFNREGDGGHARCTGNILSGASLQRGRMIRGGVSMDQKLAQHFEEETPMPSLVLGCEQPVSGFHESQYSMVYASHISWRNPDSPVPDRALPVAGLRQPLRRQGRQAAREHPRRRAGAGQRPARQGERRRPGQDRRVPVVGARDGTARPAAQPGGQKDRSGGRHRASGRRPASRRTSANTPG